MRTNDVWGVGLATMLLLTACSAGAPPGAACAGNSACVTNLCADRVCQVPCTVAADCSEGQCVGATTTSQRFCASECGFTDGSLAPIQLVDGWWCDGNLPRECSDGGSMRACETCGCPSGDICSFGSCITQRAVGEPCDSNIGCASGNCGDVARDQAICFVAPGAACDGTNCGECARRTDGTTLCQQACSASSQCPGYNPALPDVPLCWGSYGRPTETGFYCRTDCSDAPCPGGFECRQVRDDRFIYRNRCFPVDVVPGRASSP